MQPLGLTSRNPKRLPTNPAGFKIEKGPAEHYELRLWGRLPPIWIGSLCFGLCQTGISIVSGKAKKEKTVWQADFNLAATRAATEVSRINYLSLATDNLDNDTARDIFLDAFVLDADLEKHGGALYLQVTARDQLGFLGALINRCAFYALFPEALIINTVNAKVCDRFWIKGMGGGAPSDRAIDLLRQKLESCLK
jgi:hypothetical protein